MKKSLLILPILLSGCAEMSKISTPFTPPKTIRNDKCVDVEYFKIFQVIENGNALANACERKSYGDSCHGLIVFVLGKKGEDYYDDKIIKPPAGKCIAYEGVFKYTSKSGERTVPKLKIVDAEIPNPAYTK